MPINLYSSVPATQSFILPNAAKTLKSNMGSKLNTPLSPGLNPSGSAKQLQEGFPTLSSGVSTPFLFNQNS